VLAAGEKYCPGTTHGLDIDIDAVRGVRRSPRSVIFTPHRSTASKTQTITGLRASSKPLLMHIQVPTLLLQRKTIACRPAPPTRKGFRCRNFGVRILAVIGSFEGISGIIGFLPANGRFFGAGSGLRS
jgi:hypothetical protein